jgi:hypothetical protein
MNGSGWVVRKPFEDSGRVVRQHAAFAPASQKRLGFRLRSPLPSVEEPCPLSLPHGFLTTLPSPINTKPACFRTTQPEPLTSLSIIEEDAYAVEKLLDKSQYNSYFYC